MDTFLCSLVQSCCGEGGTLQTNNTGVCSQYLSHTGFALPTACVLSCLHCLGSRLLCWELSEAGPGLYALPRSKLLRFRYSGSPQRHRLGWACILCPSLVPAAQATMCLANTLSPGAVHLITSLVAAARFPGRARLQCAMCFFWGADLWLRPSWRMSTVQNLRKSLVRNWKPVCSLVGDALSGAEFAPFRL